MDFGIELYYLILNNLELGLNINIHFIAMTELIDQPTANSIASEHNPDAEEAASEDQAVLEVISTRTPTGLLDLPAEVRLMIFRHLLVCPYSLEIPSLSPRPRLPIGILRTSRLLYREAFEVLYRENRFANGGSLFPQDSLTQFPQVIDAMQNFCFGVELHDDFEPDRGFLRFMRHFGNPSIRRGALSLELWSAGYEVDPDQAPLMPPIWFIHALGRFTNFKTVELHTYHIGGRDRLCEVLDYLKTGLEPVLGDAESSSPDGKGLRFHPRDHRYRSRVPSAGDWADSLNGMRLGWNQVATNAADSESLW